MSTPSAPQPGRLLINGDWQDAASGKTFETINPADESVVTTVAEAGEPDIELAVQAAREALDHGPWGRMSAAERGKILWRMGDLIREQVNSIAMVETLDTGKTLFDSGKIEIPTAASIFEFYAGAATKLSGKTLETHPAAFTYTLREPVGVVAAIVQWNFPF